jgi:glycosyltransferase involved in cell wall biosynthesis
MGYHILQIAPPYMPISNSMKYGGIERNILYLSAEFVRKGHTVTLIAPKGSHIPGVNVIETIEPLWGDNLSKNASPTQEKASLERHYGDAIEYSIAHKHEVDLLHDHPGTGLINSESFYSRAEELGLPIVVTLHGGTNKAEKMRSLKDDLERCVANPKIHIYPNTISAAQFDYFKGSQIPFLGFIHHGVPEHMFRYNGEANPDSYLFSLGRISEIKGQDLAISLANSLNERLVIAGNVHDKDADFYKSKILPSIDGTTVKYVGELNDAQKVKWYADASVFLMPIRWDEPFGLVMIESMATGTPVVAFERGSVPEVIKNGVNGYIVPVTGNETTDLHNFAQSIIEAKKIPRYNVRRSFEQSFTVEKEAQNYIGMFDKVISEFKR